MEYYRDPYEILESVLGPVPPNAEETIIGGGLAEGRGGCEGDQEIGSTSLQDADQIPS